MTVFIFGWAIPLSKMATYSKALCNTLTQIIRIGNSICASERDLMT